MSKHINVNPGQYKVAGRERPGEDIPEPQRSHGAGGADNEAKERWVRKQQKQVEKRGSTGKGTKAL